MEIKHDLSARAAKTAEIQSMLRTNPALKLEFLAGLSKLFRDHGMPLEPEVLASLTLTMQGVHSGAEQAAGPPPVPAPHGPGIQEVYEMSV